MAIVPSIMGLYCGPELRAVPYFARYLRIKDQLYVAKPHEHITGLLLARREGVAEKIEPLRARAPDELDGGVELVQVVGGELEIAFLSALYALKIPMKNVAAQARLKTVRVAELTTPTPLIVRIRGIAEMRFEYNPHPNGNSRGSRKARIL